MPIRSCFLYTAYNVHCRSEGRDIFDPGGDM